MIDRFLLPLLLNLAPLNSHRVPGYFTSGCTFHARSRFFASSICPVRFPRAVGPVTSYSWQPSPRREYLPKQGPAAQEAGITAGIIATSAVRFLRIVFYDTSLG